MRPSCNDEVAIYLLLFKAFTRRESTTTVEYYVALLDLETIYAQAIVVLIFQYSLRLGYRELGKQQGGIRDQA